MTSSLTRSLFVDKNVRGLQQLAFGFITDTTTDLKYTATVTANTATGPIVLPSGKTIGVLIDSPDSISLNDIGLTFAFTVFTSQAMYYKETNVQAAPAA